MPSDDHLTRADSAQTICVCCRGLRRPREQLVGVCEFGGLGRATGLLLQSHRSRTHHIFVSSAYEPTIRVVLRAVWVLHGDCGGLGSAPQSSVILSF